MVGTVTIASGTTCVAVDESKEIQVYAGAVYDASVMSQTSDEDVNTMENGSVHREQCQEKEGLKYGNRSYATSDYYPGDGMSGGLVRPGDDSCGDGERCFWRHG
ncbi:hypothetical protein PC116_g18731 [Phytophthora cactorum]|nr:hypothetical protein Pcac1_g17087 [Phytophthora cactorum]KAG2811180.1 hypothetical protein PC112_g15726 [Phytophthora cactorum]KAG2811602.1 hypothetical protein PC111_g15172 [Phytophthora cactorum]KAG2891884.1 hypothetical protein PC114_g16822 [Phytophthora cactorum]KAG2991786.1 hypothetical protein PC120_g22629 [Phytophthora cactorum]